MIKSFSLWGGGCFCVCADCHEVIVVAAVVHIVQRREFVIVTVYVTVQELLLLLLLVLVWNIEVDLFKALEQSERVVDSERNLHNKQYHMFAYDQRDQLQSREAVKFPSFECCIQTQIVSVPPVNSIAHGGHTAEE